jgi:hypothetical protein
MEMRVWQPYYNAALQANPASFAFGCCFRRALVARGCDLSGLSPQFSGQQ